MVRLSDFPVAPWLRLPAFLALLIILPISTTPQTIAAAPAPCSMTDSQMKAMSDAWFATHPRTGVASLAPASGTVLWRSRLDGAAGGGVITYTVGGRQYVAFVAGTNSPIWPVDKRTAKIVVYSLAP